MALHKSALRCSIRAQRKHLSLETRRAASFALCEILVKHPIFQSSQKIAGYTAFDGEIDPLPVLKVAQSLQKKCYLPILNSNTPGALAFVPYQLGEPLVTNQFGVLEPRHTDTLISAGELDLLLLPVVGFDRLGNRLGMGGGYYDRTLGTVSQSTPYRLGLAYECQAIEKLPTNDWDIPLDGIATEKTFYECCCKE